MNESLKNFFTDGFNSVKYIRLSHTILSTGMKHQSWRTWSDPRVGLHENVNPKIYWVGSTSSEQASLLPSSRLACFKRIFYLSLVRIRSSFAYDDPVPERLPFFICYAERRGPRRRIVPFLLVWEYFMRFVSSSQYYTRLDISVWGTHVLQ